jgi:site-specific recombinase XerD
MTAQNDNGQQPSTLEEALRDFLLSRKAMLCTPRTIGFYETTAGRFTRWLLEQGVCEPTGVATSHVRAYLSEFAVRGAKSSYVHSHARAIRTFLRFLHSEGYITAPVSIRMPSVDDERLPVLSPEDLRKVVAACEQPRDRALVLLLVDTGLRRAETCSLNWGDVNIDSGLVSVARGKGGRARSVVVGVNTRRALLRYRRSARHADDAPLFQTKSGGRLTGMGLRSILVRISRRAGIHVSPHALRRTFATLSLRAGMTPLHLQGLLGHTTLEMTRRYVQMVDEDLLAAHRQHGPIDSFLRRSGKGER